MHHSMGFVLGVAGLVVALLTLVIQILAYRKEK